MMEEIVMSRELVTLLHGAAVLGEGPCWDEDRNRLIWVDIRGKALHLYDPQSDTDTLHTLEHAIGAAVPVSDGRLLLALKDGLYFYDDNSRELTFITHPESHLLNNRFNDGKCDPMGRFWIGSMDNDGLETTGSLYCLHADLRITKEVEHVGVSNGLGWSPDGTAMYYIDSMVRKVYAFDYEASTGRISNQTTLHEFTQEDGFPDGMTVDADGMLWIAFWQGSRVDRIDPTSMTVLETITIPALLATSCAFGGPLLNELYITSARSGPGDEHGGSLYKVGLGDLKGMRSSIFQYAP
jgi:sugar lactone lactonase YvrE